LQYAVDYSYYIGSTKRPHTEDKKMSKYEVQAWNGFGWTQGKTYATKQEAVKSINGTEKAENQFIVFDMNGHAHAWRVVEL
jgi:hypothetical protein